MTQQLIAAARLIGILATASCRSTPAVVKTPQPAATAPAVAVLPDSLRWVRDRAEHQAVVQSR